VQAPAPERLIKGRLPTEAMVAYVLVAKYAWHLPLYRQAEMLLAQVARRQRLIVVTNIVFYPHTALPSRLQRPANQFDPP
jgi:transposase